MEHLFEPKEGRFPVLAGHFVDGAAVPDAIAEFRKLSESGRKPFLCPELGLEYRPGDFARYRLLKFPKIAVFKLAG